MTIQNHGTISGFKYILKPAFDDAVQDEPKQEMANLMD